MKALHVVVDANQLTGQSAGSGIGTYVRELLGALGDRDDVAVTALATPDALVPAGIAHRRARRRWRTGRLAIWEHLVRLPVDLRGAPAGPFHSTDLHAPVRPRDPWVQTLYDVAPLVLADADLAALGARMRRFGPRYARADTVVAISRFAADEGVRVLGLDPTRVEVAPLGVSACFTPGPVPVGAEDEAPYVVLVGELQHRKGFDRAFAAMAAVADAGVDLRLKVAGRVGPWAEAPMAALVAASGAAGRIDVLGRVDDLPALYRGAVAAVVPSRYEGFGLPAAEAMACATPVVAFAVASLPEVVGDGGVLVPEGDIAGLAAALVSLANEPARRAELRERALARAATFSWAACAEVHAGVYRRVADA